MERGTEEDDAADRRREAAIASADSLRPNFKPKGGVNEAQLSKFQELHRRRLQIKAKSKVRKRDKGDGKGKSHNRAMKGHDWKDQDLSEPSGDSGSHSVSEKRVEDFPSMEGKQDDDDVAGNAVEKRRQKLFWGLDTKERWERKSNM